jgi:DNA-binding response OmpR family regulator
MTPPRMRHRTSLLRVLLVDRTIHEREAYAEYLRMRGFCTLQADNAADGYRLVTELAPSVVIAVTGVLGSDDGLALTRRLKSCETTKRTPIILLTGHVRDCDYHVATMAGCDRFLSKPCSPSTLAATVDELMRPSG